MPSSLSGVRGVTTAIREAILNCAWREIAGVECFRLVTFTSADYPKSLFEIPDPPPFLYVQGEVRCHETSVAIVGSRRATAYGIQATTRLAESLAGHGVTMIFGMARGVDTAAHKGALAAGSRTIGVLGCGIDKVYPPENKKLFQEMAEKGCLVSEFPLGTLPLAKTFPAATRSSAASPAGCWWWRRPRTAAR